MFHVDINLPSCVKLSRVAIRFTGEITYTTLVISFFIHCCTQSVSRVVVCLIIVERTLVYFTYSAHPIEFARSITIESCKCIFGDTVPSETHPAHCVWWLYKSRTSNIIFVALLFFSQEVITSGAAFHVNIYRSPGDTRSSVAIILLATKQFTMKKMLGISISYIGNEWQEILVYCDKLWITYT